MHTKEHIKGMYANHSSMIKWIENERTHVQFQQILLGEKTI